MPYLFLLALRTHGHCCSTQCGMKLMSMLSKSKGTVKARRLILSCQTLMMTKSWAMWCHLTCTDSIQRCTIWEEFKDRTFTILVGRVQLYNSLAVMVNVYCTQD